MINKAIAIFLILGLLVFAGIQAKRLAGFGGEIHQTKDEVGGYHQKISEQRKSLAAAQEEQKQRAEENQRALAESEARKAKIGSQLVELGFTQDEVDRYAVRDPESSSRQSLITYRAYTALPGDVRLSNGAMLNQAVVQPSDFSNRLILENQDDGDAIVRLYDGEHTVGEFYVRGEETAEIMGVADGAYSISFTKGFGWIPEEKRFKRGNKKKEMQELFVFSTEIKIVDGQETVMAGGQKLLMYVRDVFTYKPDD